MQSKEDLEKHYYDPDPWGYKRSIEDEIRRDRILSVANMFAPYDLALDIACGEGWITQSIAAREVHGYEMSDNAAARFPQGVKRIITPTFKYDFIMATGCLYGHYDCQSFIDIINKCASRIILTCNIQAWESTKINAINARQIVYMVFPYHTGTEQHNQVLRVFKV